jgi:hypothetical protein
MAALGLTVATVGCAAGGGSGDGAATSSGARPNSIVAGAADSVESIPGSPDAPYIYRFRQIDPGGSGFTFQDRDLSFHFRPGPEALYFQVENRQNRLVWLDWERSVFYDPNGRTDKVAHAATRWDDRFKSQASTQIPGLQVYGDYVLPLGYLYDPAGRSEQLHRPLLPEDSTAPTYTDKVFGVDLAFVVEDRPRAYAFRFKVASVIPR